MLCTMFKEWGWHAEEADDGSAAVAIVWEKPFDAVLMDVRMAKMDGMEALQKIHTYNPAIPVIIMTAYSSVDMAVEAIKNGAHDYLTKPLDFDRLKLAMDRAMDHRQVQENKSAVQQSNEKVVLQDMGRIIGSSPSMMEMLEMISFVAPTEATSL